MQQLVPRLAIFDESNLIALHSFLRLLRSARNALRLSESLACTCVMWFLGKPVIMFDLVTRSQKFALPFAEWWRGL